MDHAENIRYQLDSFTLDPMSATSIALIIVQLIRKVSRLLQKNTMAQRRCKKECEELKELLTSIRPDVITTESAVRLCKEGGIEMTPEDSWLRRLEKELEETSGLLDKFSDNSGVLKYITGDGLPKKITTQMETLTKFANELPLLHVGLQNLLIHRAASQPYNFSSTRRLPSFKNHRYHDTEYSSVFDSFRPSSSIIRLPSFERHCYPDAEFFMRDGVYFTRIPVSHPHFCTQVSFSRLPVTNPHYFKQVESEYYR
ncbi:hypothetical protein KC19_4G031600 [Ceratodon purpureus]|uniref:Uncharacterized protein n=1 Tax=Ceratodon purpureus TaxID=3225 RepID=A0A8T0I7Z1_CERPU|nr:hypothetical protein KC19_4G031600 [Ceratodon purpureus]